MKTFLVSVFSILVLASCNQPQQSGSDITVSSDDKGKKSYSVGYDLGRNIPRAIGSISNLDIDQFVQGMKDALKNNPQLTDEEIRTLVEQFRTEAMANRAKEFNDKGQKNLEEGKKFLAENKSKEGVKETASGLQYKIIKPGTGKQPKATDRVEVHYEGTLLDGTVFDSSYKRGETIEFGLNQVIKGWTEGVQLIKEGGEIMLYIPHDLAYGSSGSGSSIGPNSTLIFKVELFSVK
jgi:FKBP-type peptidyl-prolyl cis-trans isomerase FklB